MTDRETLLATTINHLAIIENGQEYPENACTQFVITNGQAFFNLNGQGFKTSPRDFAKRYAPVYRTTYDDARWNICYDIHGATAEMAEHIDNIHRLTTPAYESIAKLLNSSDITQKLAGNLFLLYCSKPDRDQMLLAQRKLAQNKPQAPQYTPDA